MHIASHDVLSVILLQISFYRLGGKEMSHMRQFFYALKGGSSNIKKQKKVVLLFLKTKKLKGQMI